MDETSMYDAVAGSIIVIILIIGIITAAIFQARENFKQLYVIRKKYRLGKKSINIRDTLPPNLLVMCTRRSVEISFSRCIEIDNEGEVGEDWELVTYVFPKNLLGFYNQAKEFQDLHWECWRDFRNSMRD